MSQLAQMVRAKHPGAYDDLDDQALDRMVRAKYPGAYDDIPGPDQAGSGPVSRFVSGAWEMLNPVPMVEAALSPIETGKALLGAQEQTALKGLQAEQEGRGAAAVAYKLASGVPILGPLAAGIAERASDGDLAGAAGNVAGIVAAPGAYLKAGKLAAKGAAAAGPAAQRVAASAGSVGQAIRHPIEYAKANPNAAGMAAGALTELAIGNLGAAVATGFGARMATRWLAGQAAAKAKNAIKSSMNGQGMSGAQAENVIIKMSPEEFVDAAKRAGVEVAVPPEAIVMAPSPRATTLGAGRAPVQPPQAPPMSGSGMPVAVEPSRLDSVGLSRASSSLPQGSIAPPMGSSGFRVARAAQAAPEPPPVAPGMAQDLVPDQLAPEISPAAPEMPVAPPAQAGGVSIPTPAVTVAEDQAARLARQKQHIADSYAAKEAKAAENLAAGETMEADLVASIERMKASPKKPGESLAQWKARIESESGATIEVPAEAMEAAEMIRARVERMQDSGLSKAQAADEVLGNILPKARPVDVQEMVNDIYSARAVKQAEAPPVVKAEAPPAPSPAKPADVPVHPNDTHQYGARQYTHEGAQALEVAKEQMREVIRKPDYPGKVADLEAAKERIDNASVAGSKAPKPLDFVTTFSKDPAMAKKQRAFNERLEAYFTQQKLEGKPLPKRYEQAFKKWSEKRGSVGQPLVLDDTYSPSMREAAEAAKANPKPGKLGSDLGTMGGKKAKVLLRDVKAAERAYQSSSQQWGENNMQTQRDFIKMMELRERYAASKGSK